MGGRQRRKVASPDMMDSGQRSASGWSSAWWIWVGGVTGHERGDVGRVEQAVRAWLQVLQVSEVTDVALWCHGDQQLGGLVGGGVAEPVRDADRSGEQRSGGQHVLRGAGDEAHRPTQDIEGF